MNAFNTTGPSIFSTDRAFTAQGDKGRSLSQSATARYAGLTDPRNNMRKGGISLPAGLQRQDGKDYWQGAGCTEE